MLAGRYPSEEFAELRPRIVWDRVSGMLTGRPGAQRLAVTCGGTIPDRGLFGVFLAGGEGAGRRVGELDEEMVYESRVGDIFTLGSSWRIEDITPDQVLVTPAPGLPGRLPFWKGDTLGRPAELGQAVGGWSASWAPSPAAEARERVARPAWTSGPPTTCSPTSPSSARRPGSCPSDRAIVVERFRDELGDWRVGCTRRTARRCTRRGRSSSGPGCASGTASTCGHARRRRDRAPAARPRVRRRATRGGGDGGPRGGGEQGGRMADCLSCSTPTRCTTGTAEIGGSAMFGARFRECAARALLLPAAAARPPPAALAAAAAVGPAARGRLPVPDFPIVLEAVRECLQDDFDVPGLVALMRDPARARSGWSR